MNQETDHPYKSWRAAKDRTAVKMTVAEPCYITDIDTDTYTNLTSRNHYNTASNFVLGAGHSASNLCDRSRLIAEMTTFCTVQKAMLIKSKRLPDEKNSVSQSAEDEIRALVTSICGGLERKPGRDIKEPENSQHED